MSGEVVVHEDAAETGISHLSRPATAEDAGDQGGAA